ncbi:hypothetical protein EDB92DRAFT_1821054 [Lactarius akahatsu]|uniref:Uncharacterized protein n=1 Tax=Lactarius akahatsu TaxID=416441 RepID=A0AAD4L5V9_9AGAM|nr:hypothetical protein EDB92DRAFT_1821054 [Lactarius akahatsu]
MCPCPIRVSPLRSNLGRVTWVYAYPPLHMNGGTCKWVKDRAPLPIPMPPLVACPLHVNREKRRGPPRHFRGCTWPTPSHSHVTPHHSPVGIPPPSHAGLPHTACAPPRSSVLRKEGCKGGPGGSLVWVEGANEGATFPPICAQMGSCEAKPYPFGPTSCAAPCSHTNGSGGAKGGSCPTWSPFTSCLLVNEDGGGKNGWRGLGQNGGGSRAHTKGDKWGAHLSHAPFARKRGLGAKGGMPLPIHAQTEVGSQRGGLVPRGPCSRILFVREQG